MSTNTALYLVGSYQPLLLDQTPDLPNLRGESPDESPKELYKYKIGDSLNIFLIIVTAVTFITIITWFNVLSHLYEDVFNPINKENRYRATFLSLGYAIIVAMIAVFVYILYRSSN